MLKLDSVNAKLARAKAHRDILEREVFSWYDSKPYAIVTEVNAEKTCYNKIIRFNSPPDLVAWSLILGDAIHCLRSSLDHLVTAIAAHELDTATRAKIRKKLAFIIRDTEDDWNSRYFQIEKLSAPVKAAIKSVQPITRKHTVLPPLLALLRDLDDADKHHALRVSLLKVMRAKFKELRNVPPDGEFHITKEGLEDGAGLTSLRLKKPTSDVDYNFELSADVVVEHGAGPNGCNSSGVVKIFDDLDAEVRWVIDHVVASVQDKTRLNTEVVEARPSAANFVLKSLDEQEFRSKTAASVRQMHAQGRQKKRAFWKTTTPSGRVIAQQVGWYVEVDPVAFREELGEEL